MSKEAPPKKPRSTKKVTEGSNTAELEAKIAQLEAKLANLSSQVKPAETKPAQTSESKPRPAASGPTHGTLPAGMKSAEAPKPEPKPQQRPAASGPTHGTLPAGMKPAEAPKPQPAPETTSHPQEPSAGEVAPAYAQISSTGYTGNKYFATRKRLSYHPADKQFTGSSTTTTTAPPAPQQHETQTSTTHDTHSEGAKPQEKKSLWKAKGSDVAETYVGEDEPKPQQRPAASGPTHGTLPAGMKSAEAPKPEPKPQQRPAASGPTHGTLPAGMKPAEAPKPQPAPETTSHPQEPSAGEVAPAYAQISSTGYTGNKYFATRKRLSYHPADKQFTGSSTSTAPQPAAEPAKPKSTFRTTLPAGFKA